MSRPPRVARRRFHCMRGGFSLMEVILALAILVGAIAVLGELVQLGTRGAAGARDLTRAQLLCESKLGEVLAGLIPPDPVQYVDFDLYSDPEGEWQYSIEMQPVDETGLAVLRVTVTQSLPPQARPVEFSLTRWIQDPALDLSAAATGAAGGSSSPVGSGAAL